MIYIILKMFKPFEPLLKGVNQFTQPIELELKNHDMNMIESLDIAGRIHKEVRRHLQNYLKPDIKLIDIAKFVDMKIIEITDIISPSNSINKGIGFPTLLSLNECAAHYHPTSYDKTKFQNDDILKIDFGTEINGWIIDSAFTVCFDSKYDPLLEAVKEATNNGIKTAGIDVNICDWGIANQEIMESYEISLNNKTIPIKSIINLGGHNIKNGLIHGGVFLPCADVRNKFDENYKFKEDIYAIETFGSTGLNYVKENGENTLFRLNTNIFHNKKIFNDETRYLLNFIKKNYKTLPFAERYIEHIPNYKKYLNNLTNDKILLQYPPLCIDKGSYTAQYEHTILINENKKIIFSKSEDY